MRSKGRQRAYFYMRLSHMSKNSIQFNSTIQLFQISRRQKEERGGPRGRQRAYFSMRPSHMCLKIQFISPTPIPSPPTRRISHIAHGGADSDSKPRSHCSLASRCLASRERERERKKKEKRRFQEAREGHLRGEDTAMWFLY